MSDYHAPLKDMQFVLEHIVDLEKIAALPGHEDVGADLAAAVLEEAGRFASGVLAPLNKSGDEHGARLAGDAVTTAPGWIDAYRQFVDGGWNGLSCNPDHGGQGLPWVVSCLVEEIWNAANMAFTLCPMLTRGAIEALELCGNDAQKALYLDKLVSGEWTGTMNLTESQAGSDLAAVRTKALRQPDGSFRLHGQKIFITYGDHDLTPNIIHLVLARTPEAPEGVKGLSLFVVPKFLPDGQGAPGRRNDVRCVSLEHKLGIHASPTAVLSFGDGEGAAGWLVGEEGRGLEYMFIMMNAARYSVGIEGVGLCERAYQRALAYARDRVQGVEIGAGRDKVAIIRHPDVRRMLMLMRSRTEALRALAVDVAAAGDHAERNPDPQVRELSQAYVDLMIPVIKGWSTESAVAVTSLGVQIHGGMGFIEETGAAQHLRDARITTIYEGTTGIQALDLVGRKIGRDRGKAAMTLVARMRQTVGDLTASGAEDAVLAARLAAGVDALESVVHYLAGEFAQAPRLAAAGSVPALELFGIVAGGWMHGRSVLAARRALARPDADAAFLHAKVASGNFYSSHVLAQAAGLAAIVREGGSAVFGVADSDF